MRDRKLMMMAIAASMNPLAGIADKYGFNRIGSGSTPNKYKPHQGKQECARRLRKGSAAWHSGR